MIIEGKRREAELGVSASTAARLPNGSLRKWSAAAIPKLFDDHIGYRGAPAYLVCCSGQQDGVDVEQAG
jgi:hypothetical protein